MVFEDVNADGMADVILYNRTSGTDYTFVSTSGYYYSFWGPGKILAK